MVKNEASSEGAASARLFSASSRALKISRGLNNLIVGNNNIPKGWRYLGQAAHKLPEGVTFEGDPDATRLPIPRLYKMAGVMAVQATEMQRLLYRNPYAFYAVALKFGSAVVMGAFEPGVKFEREIQPGSDLVGVRIGHEGVTAVPGLWNPRDERFDPAESAQFYSRSDLASVPENIPIA